MKTSNFYTNPEELTDDYFTQKNVRTMKSELAMFGKNYLKRNPTPKKFFAKLFSSSEERTAASQFSALDALHINSEISLLRIINQIIHKASTLSREFLSGIETCIRKNLSQESSAPFIKTYNENEAFQLQYSESSGSSIEYTSLTSAISEVIRQKPEVRLTDFKEIAEEQTVNNQQPIKCC